jgi:hypothetical protein
MTYLPNRATSYLQLPDSFVSQQLSEQCEQADDRQPAGPKARYAAPSQIAKLMPPPIKNMTPPLATLPH